MESLTGEAVMLMLRLAYISGGMARSLELQEYIVKRLKWPILVRINPRSLSGAGQNPILSFL